MQRFVRLLSSPHWSWNDSTPVCEWGGVVCDDEANVLGINWTPYSDPLGELNWDALPMTVRTLRIGGQPASPRHFSGRIHTPELPQRLLTFYASYCNFDGEIEWNSLPPTLYEFSVTRNTLSGKLTLTSLPLSLKVLHLGENKFTGEIDLTHLPPRLAILWAYDNALSGEISLTRLPPQFLSLRLQDNALRGPLDLTALPATLSVLHLQRNAFVGVVDFTSLPRTAQVDVSDNALDGFRGTRHREYVEWGVQHPPGGCRCPGQEKRETSDEGRERGNHAFHCIASSLVLVQVAPPVRCFRLFYDER